MDSGIFAPCAIGIDRPGRPSAPGGRKKSVILAVFASLLLGPLGMAYTTTAGAAAMFFVNLYVLAVTAGAGLLVTIPVGAVWAGAAAAQHNARLSGVSSSSPAGARPRRS